VHTPARRHARGSRTRLIVISALAAALIVAGGAEAGLLRAGGGHPPAATWAGAGTPAAAPSAGPSATRPAPGTSAPTAPSASPSAGPARTGGTGGLADQVVTLVNRERARAGCRALTVDGRLTDAALAHSTDMAGRNYFSHDDPEGDDPGRRITEAGYRWSAYGENIAAGYTDAASVMDGWMHSPGHRANILNCDFRNIGVGVAINGSRKKYWTQDFGAPR
jgi:uncharacterized protein YkwD